MTTETGSPRSRRALLAAGAAAGVATIASALGRPSPASAASGTFDSASGVPAVTATSTAASGGAFGVYAQSFSTDGTGVAGAATAATGVTIGVLGESSSTNGQGVVGRAIAATGGTVGVGGQSSSTGGTGVLGYAYAATGPTRGVWGESSSTSGTGVYGHNYYGVGTQGDSNLSYGLVGTSAAIGTAAVLGRSDGDSTGVIGKSGPGDPASPAKTGVYGYAAQDGASIGVTGLSPAGTGVKGLTTSGTGVYAESESGYGVFANVGSPAVAALFGNSNGGPGLWAQTDGANAGVVGWSNGGARTGVLGYSGPGDVPAAPAKTGVYGYAAQDASARGVWGRTVSGQGVYGQASNGQGVRGYAATGTALYGATSGLKKGLALRTIGRVRMDNSVGIATITSGTSSIVVTPGIDLVTTSAVTATLMGDAGGSTTVKLVSIDATIDTFTIHLTANATANVKVAWHVFG